MIKMNNSNNNQGECFRKEDWGTIRGEVAGDPTLPRDISCVKVLDGRKQRFEGSEKVILTDLLEFIKVHDLDVILLPYADTWVPLCREDETLWLGANIQPQRLVQSDGIGKFLFRYIQYGIVEEIH